MNILLVRPDSPKESINLQSFMICEPLELEYVARALIDEGHNVELIDMLLEDKPIEYFLTLKKYDMVCFTAYITTVGMVKKYAKTVKDYDSNILIAVGGVHAEVVPADFESKDIDFILWANGVNTLVDICRDYPNLNEYPGVYKKGEKKPVIVNGNLKFPLRSITKKYRDKYNYIYHNNCATIKTSYGCPYKCSFCFCTRICDYSIRSLDSIFDELSEIEEKNVFIVDDNFLVDRKRVIDFCEGLLERKIDKHYIAFGRADFIVKNPDLIPILHSVGFDAFFVGIESFKKNELSDFNKQSTVEENIKAINILESNDMQCYSGLIVTEDWVKEDFDVLINYLNSFEHPLVNIQPITPMPGTPLFDSYPYVKTIKREEYGCWDMAHVVFNPINMTKRDYYYHIVRAYLKTSANKKQRKFIKEKYGIEVYKRVRRGATKIFFQYVKLMIKPK